MIDSLNEQPVRKSKSTRLILVILLASMFLCFLSFLLLFFFLTRDSSVTTNVEQKDDTPTLDASSDWLEYRNTKYGFTMLYPDIGLTPREVEVFETKKTDYLYCDTGIPACPSFVEGKYKIGFFDNSSQEAFSIEIYDTELIPDELSGRTFDGYTYLVYRPTYYEKDEGWVNKIISIEDRNEMSESIEFIETEKPKTCLWEKTYYSYTKEEADLLQNDVYSYIKLRNGDISIYGAENKMDEPRRYSGWRYNWGGDCEEIEFYTWSEDSSAPPFRSRSECVQTCMTND